MQALVRDRGHDYAGPGAIDTRPLHGRYFIHSTLIFVGLAFGLAGPNNSTFYCIILALACLVCLIFTYHRNRVLHLLGLPILAAMAVLCGFLGTVMLLYALTPSSSPSTFLVELGQVLLALLFLSLAGYSVYTVCDILFGRRNG